MLLSLSDVYSILISKHFLGRFSLLRNYKLKSVADIMLRTLHICFINFIQLGILFKLCSNFLDLSAIVLGIAIDLVYNQPQGIYRDGKAEIG